MKVQLLIAGPWGGGHSVCVDPPPHNVYGVFADQEVLMSHNTSSVCVCVCVLPRVCTVISSVPWRSRYNRKQEGS